MNKKERSEQDKKNHIEALKSLGFNGSFRTLRILENKARWFSLQWCDGKISLDTMNQEHDAIEAKVKTLFGGTLPQGFFINSDPRGTALKLDDDKTVLPVGFWRDFGGYGVLAPDFS